MSVYRYIPPIYQPPLNLYILPNLCIPQNPSWHLTLQQNNSPHLSMDTRNQPLPQNNLPHLRNTLFPPTINRPRHPCHHKAPQRLPPSSPAACKAPSLRTSARAASSPSASQATKNVPPRSRWPPSSLVPSPRTFPPSWKPPPAQARPSISILPSQLQPAGNPWATSSSATSSSTNRASQPSSPRPSTSCTIAPATRSSSPTAPPSSPTPNTNGSPLQAYPLNQSPNQNMSVYRYIPPIYRPPPSLSHPPPPHPRSPLLPSSRPPKWPPRSRLAQCPLRITPSLSPARSHCPTRTCSSHPISLASGSVMVIAIITRLRRSMPQNSSPK